MKERFIPQLVKALSTVGVPAGELNLEFPENLEYGDCSTNIALVSAKKLGMSPRALAEKIVAEFEKEMPDVVESVKVAGAGFINFKLKDEVFVGEVLRISTSSEPAPSRRQQSSVSSQAPRGRLFSPASAANARKVLIEYTDPNAFKVFHIGHLMANAIGESLSRLIEYSGAKVTRICYPSDIGLHIAKSIWAMRKHSSEIPGEADSIQKRTEFLGKMYVEGTKSYEDDPMIKGEIDAINKVIYEGSDPRPNLGRVGLGNEVHVLYEKGKKWSFEHFELLYERLGTKFDDYIYESEMAPVGLKIVKEYLKKGVFEESEGAIVFHGEKYGLHTRVFVNSAELPIYEAKDLGLNATKFEKYPDTDQSIIVTANEQNDYFKVLIKALSLIDEKVGAKTKHIGHGLLRFASGKMSSRTGNVIAAEALIEEIKEMVRGKMEKNEKVKSKNENKEDEIADAVAIGAIKYTILRQSIGSDVIFDSAKSISFEGDSGPYLQYSAVRAGAVLEKAQIVGVPDDSRGGTNMGSVVSKTKSLERMIVRFPEIVERAKNEYAPQLVANYLIALAGEFNSFYAKQTIVDKGDPASPYYVALTKAFRRVMEDGLWILGIVVPERM